MRRGQNKPEEKEEEKKGGRGEEGGGNEVNKFGLFGVGLFENTAVMLDCREKPRGQGQQYIRKLLTLAGKKFKGQILRHMCQSHFGFNIFLKLNIITGQIKVCLTFWM